ncbi:MAG TPA: tetratricopeptide repeat protein [Gemmatimonadaceae bacterium]
MPIRPLILAGLLCASRAYAQHDDHKTPGRHGVHTAALGHVTFPNSGSAAAQKPFLTGLALLHSFEYDAAADSFRVATKIDPKFALAYWMEALTNSKVIWGLEDLPAARATLARLAPSTESRLALARSPGERAFGSAVEAFYGEGELRSRVSRFAEALRRWTVSMPSDPEARAFAALALIWEAYYLRAGAADSLNREAVTHAQYLFDRNPQHPGAAHYIIHASDAPAAAHRGLRAAREYSRIAPDAEHALHMPSHIFLPLGLWDDMVDSNERAWRASRADVARHDDPAWENDWHSLNWLQYAYLQLGRWKDARALIDTARALTAGMQDKVKAADLPDAAYATEELAFRYGAETGDWSAFPVDSVRIDTKDATISVRARSMALGSLYQRGTIAAMRGDSTTAITMAEAIRAPREAMASLIEISLLEKRGDRRTVIAALEKLRPQARVDRYSSMRPSPVLNIDETLGAALVVAGRPRDAIEVYREALKDRPGRAASLLGLARAQSAAGDKSAAGQTYAELAKIWNRADPEVKALIEK